MKNAIKLVTLAFGMFLISAVSGCTDFPEHFFADASIGIRVKDDVRLSSDGRRYESTILVDFNIKDNPFGSISSATVYIIGENEYEVGRALDPNVGGTVEIPYTCSTTYPEVKVRITLTIATQNFVREETVTPSSYIEHMDISAGKADNITPRSADLHIDTKYPWFISSGATYLMLVSTEQFDIPLNTSIDNFNGKSFSSRTNANDEIICTATGLLPNTTYYYRVAKVESNNVVYISATNSFKTAEATTEIKNTVTGIGITSAKITPSFTPGNIGSFTSSQYTGGHLRWYIGETMEELEASTDNRAYVTDPYIFRGLNASTKYYYRCDFYIINDYICSSDIQEFTTEESTASLTTIKCEAYETHAYVHVELDKGNTTSIISPFTDSDAFPMVKVFCGTSKDNMTYANGSNALNINTFLLSMDKLTKNTKYYYEVRYYAGNSILASTGVAEFTTN